MSHKWPVPTYQADEKRRLSFLGPSPPALTVPACLAAAGVHRASKGRSCSRGLGSTLVSWGQAEAACASCLEGPRLGWAPSAPLLWVGPRVPKTSHRKAVLEVEAFLWLPARPLPTTLSLSVVPACTISNLPSEQGGGGRRRPRKRT